MKLTHPSALFEMPFMHVGCILYISSTILWNKECILYLLKLGFNLQSEFTHFSQPDPVSTGKGIAGSKLGSEFCSWFYLSKPWRAVAKPSLKAPLVLMSKSGIFISCSTLHHWNHLFNWGWGQGEPHKCVCHFKCCSPAEFGNFFLENPIFRHHILHANSAQLWMQSISLFFSYQT